MEKSDTQFPRAREKALRVLERVQVEQAYASPLLKSEARDLDPAARAFFQHLVKGTLQWRDLLDKIVASYLSGDRSGVPPQVLLILQLATYQLLFLDRAPVAVVVNEAVMLVKRRKHFKFAGVVNAILRRIASAREKHRAEIYGDLATPEALALSLSHPEWMVQRWTERWGMEEARALCVWNNSQWPLTLRVNTLRVDCTTLLSRLQEEGLSVVASRFAPDCLQLLSKPQALRWEDLVTFQEGLFLIQDESAALISHLLAPEPGEEVVDLCSAPGGKATHLATLMRNEGRVYAYDLHRRRLALVDENARRLGITIIECVEGDARSTASTRQVDRVLLDVPCSGLGVLGRKAEIRWRITADEIANLSSLQGELLASAACWVKPGGRLLYSTCTIEPEENERVVEHFLKQNAQFRLVPALVLPADLRTEQGFYFSIPQRVQMAGAFGALLERVL